MKNLGKLAGFLSIIAVIGLSLAGCDDGSNNPTPTPTPQPLVTVTKTVTVSFPPYSYGISVTSFSLTPTYTPEGNDWGTHFSTTDISYIIDVTSLSYPTFSKTYTNGTGFNINISDYPETYGIADTLTFVQTFKMGNTTLGSQIIRILVTPSTNFANMRDAENNNIMDNPATIPTVNLTLTKQVSEG